MMFRRQTPVETVDPDTPRVVVSTVRLPWKPQEYETMVFPADSDGNINTEREIYTGHAATPKEAKRMHRVTCKQFDALHRAYSFDSRRRNYAPVTA